MTSRKTILILMHNSATQFIDIANQYVKLFDPKKYHVTVAYLSGQLDEKAKARTLSEEVIFLNCSKKSIRGMKINPIKKLIGLCREQHYAMVICHRYKPIYIMLWVAQFCQIPALFFILHAMHTLDFISRKIFIAALARKNMYFAGVSDAVRDDLRRAIWCVPKNQVITLYNCIDVELTEEKLLPRSHARSELQLAEDALVFGTIGRLAPEKDQKNMLHAFAKIKPHLPKATLIIIGEGPLENTLKQLSEQLGLTHHIIFTGFIPEAARYLKAFDVFILSSIKEAFGRVLLEAMVAKVPVIGTHTHGIPEVIGDAGMLVRPSDSDKLAAAMLAMARQTSDELTRSGEQAYQHVKKNFSLEKFNAVFWGNHPERCD